MALYPDPAAPVSLLGGLTLNMLRPVLNEDMQAYVQSIVNRFEEANDLARDRTEEQDGVDMPGFAFLFDKERVPVKWFPWLGNMAGTTIPAQPPDEPDASYRARASAMIDVNESTRRGSPDAILDAVALGLDEDGPQTILYNERIGGNAYRGSIAVFTDHVLPGWDQQRFEDVIKKAKPGAVIIDFTIIEGISYEALSATHASYADLMSIFADYNEVRTNPTKQ